MPRCGRWSRPPNKPSERVYKPDGRPDVEVLVDGMWRVGELRMWRQDEAGSWWGQVQYRPADEPTRVLVTVPAEQIREV